ncbi:MAG: hypothetical protein M3539_05530, partial [Acidobacteriota bacterium]|nr:hypothetical protein [Acidobacteriota bacterium]
FATDPATRARLQGEAGNSLVATGNPRGLDHVREALSVLDPETNPLETANAIAIEGRFHHLAGQHEKALELLTRAAELVAPASTPETVSLFAASVITTIYAWLAGAYQHSGLFSDGDVWARRAIEFGVSHNILIAQALGNEFLAEDAINSGDHAAGLEYARREIEIAEKLHSRERRAWAQFSAAMNAMGGGDLDLAEREFKKGIEIAESIGELRLHSLLRGNLATLQADQGQLAGDRQRLDEALQTAQENFEQGESLGLIYSRAEARRCLAHVHFRRGELDEAERLCAESLELISATESRVSRLWLGPLYIQLLLAISEQASAAGDAEKAATKRAEAANHLERYTKLVASCQSPRFSREVERLSKLLPRS